MKKYLLLPLLLFCLHICSQNKINFKLESVTKMINEEEQDTINLIKPRTISIFANPLSQITEIAKIENYTIGLQIEILKSNLESPGHLVIGHVFYKKKAGDNIWEFFIGHDYWPVYDSNGKLSTKGEQVSSQGFRLTDNGIDFTIFYTIYVN